MWSLNKEQINKIRIQKNYIICILIIFNLFLSITFGLFQKYWYAYVLVLALGSSIQTLTCINLLFYKIYTSFSKTKIQDRNNLNVNTPKSYVYVVPCYNESQEELTRTLDSIANQTPHNPIDKKLIFIICDGKVKGKNNSTSTDKILIEKILYNSIVPLNSISKENIYPDFQYKTWDYTFQSCDIYVGNYCHIPYILIIKNSNYGKRDSLVLLRRILYYYNKWFISQKKQFEFIFSEWYNNNMWEIITSYLKSILNSPIKYIIGTDADTILDKDCTLQLITSIEKDDNIMGCVGLVDIDASCNWWSPYVMYQKAEYLYSQFLKRQHQSLITKKVNCLSGCVQILRISNETCGPRILSEFNKLPIYSTNILDHIRSYASEDRNHVCLMLSYYPYVKTIQNLKAIAYTIVPNNWEVFLSQRRRWSLGATSNDILLLSLKGIFFWEKIIALTNILTFSTGPFIVVATAFFIRAIILNKSILMLYLALILIIPFIYGITVPYMRKLSWKSTLYYVVCFLYFHIIGPLVNLAIFSYSLSQLDKINWGKTRSIAKIDKNLKDDNNKNNLDITRIENKKIENIETQYNNKNDKNDKNNFDILIETIDPIFNKEKIGNILLYNNLIDSDQKINIDNKHQIYLDTTFWNLECDSEIDVSNNCNNSNSTNLILSNISSISSNIQIDINIDIDNNSNIIIPKFELKIPKLELKSQSEDYIEVKDYHTSEYLEIAN
jgi:chitin synthase